jgi:acetoin utilization deacetylase AcuC-like enzyme
MSKLGIIYDYQFLDHKIDTFSPENPDRLKNLYIEIANPKYAHLYKKYLPQVITSNLLHRIHSEFYIEQLRSFSFCINPYSYDKDTYLMEDSLYVAKLSSGSNIVLIDALMNNEIDIGFSLCRPPGHHALPERGMGYCIFNNASISTRYLLDKYNINKILILDFDVHHGNGTEEIFYSNNNVLTVSIHQRNIFPFTGHVQDVGIEEGKGYNINIPVYPQYGDEEYLYLFDNIIKKICEEYNPDFFIVSAGYDGHMDDNTSDTTLTYIGYQNIIRRIKSYIQTMNNKKALFLLEGGYNPNVLERCILDTLEELSTSYTNIHLTEQSSRAQLLVEKEIKPILKEYWPSIF